jgi:SAM-dependent methyltransferase
MWLVSTVSYYWKKVVKEIFPDPTNAQLIRNYISAGRIPWSKGYAEYKMDFIRKSLQDAALLKNFASNNIPLAFAIGIDERAVEYPWIFSRLTSGKKKLLDAGSTFNFAEIVEQESVMQKDLTILTFFPEPNAFYKKRISYSYSDLREMPFRNEYFDEIVCQSTLEHIDMDNTIYGYDIDKTNRERKSYEYLNVISELIRVLKHSGLLLLTFPYGKFENHGFFQQFDGEMVGRIEDMLKKSGEYSISYFVYSANGWLFASKENCDSSESYNPHTGRGKGNDGAAHCRGICCIEFVKKLK